MSERMELAKRLRAEAHQVQLSRDRLDSKQHYFDLLAAASAIEAGEWREIASAPDSEELLVGQWMGNESFWGTRYCHKVIAKMYNYTHYLPLPDPPEVTR